MTIRDDDFVSETLYESPGYHVIAGLIRSKDPQICGHHCCGPCGRQAAQAKERLRAEAEQEIREAAKAKAEQERLEEEQKAEQERF